MHWRITIQALFFKQIAPYSLVFFRIAFGVCMLVEVWRYFKHDWVARYFIIPEFHFTYWPFDFLSPLPGNGMYWLFALLGLCALFIALGCFYRVAATLFFL